MKKYKIGYTQGTYDLFHIGHLNLLKNAKSQCDFLIVGVNSDTLVKEYKNKDTVIKQDDRSAIVNSIKYVDKVYITNTLDKNEIAKYIDFDVIFIGSDWQNNQRWMETKKDMLKKGIDVVFLPHTNGISTTLITKSLDKNNI